MIRCVLGDITIYFADVIVNAANSHLIGGGGVDGAIHAAAGPTVMAELNEIRHDVVPLKPGRVVFTEAGRLPAKFIFHAVGPVWRGGGQGEVGALAACYRSCMAMAYALSARSIAFPAISTGIYQFPKDLAAEIAVREVMANNCTDIDVSFVLYDRENLSIYQSLLAQVRA